MKMMDASKWTQAKEQNVIVLQTLVSNVQKLLELVLALLQDKLKILLLTIERSFCIILFIDTEHMFETDSINT